MERAVPRGHHHRSVHRMRRLRGHLSARRHRLRARGGQVHPVPPRSGAGPRRLRARLRVRRRLHHVHPGLPALSGMGAERRHAPVRAGARARRDVRHLASAAAHPGGRRHPAPARARTAASSRRCSTGSRTTTTSTRRWSPAWKTTTIGRPSRSSPTTRPSSPPPPAAATRTAPTRWRCVRPRTRACPASPWWAWAARRRRPRRCGIARPARCPSRSCSTSGCCAPRRSTTRSSPSCSRPSTA